MPTTACPLDCPDACTLDVTVVDGKIVAVDAAPGNPLTDGWICQKVKHHARRVYAPERVMTPLERVGPKGSGSFRPVSWEAAIERIASRIEEISGGPHGPAAIVPYLYNSSAGDLAATALSQRLWRRVGASYVLPTICATTAGTAYDMVYGGMLSADPFDLVDARAVVIWGANPSISNTHLIPLMQRARDNGARVTVVDPRRTATAARADRHLAVLPGTDVVLAYAIADQLRRCGLIDEQFLSARVNGVEQFLDAAAAWPVERAASICGVDASDIAAMAGEYGTIKPSFLRMGWGLERNRNGGSACRAVLTLPLLCGHFGVPGSGVMTSLSSGAPLSLRDADPDTDTSPRPNRRLVNMNTIGALLGSELDGPPVELLFVQGANIAVMNPAQRKVLRGLERDDLFTVVHDQVLTDTARYADLVLPAPTHFETRDLKHSYGTYALMQLHPVVDRIGESKTNDELAALLALRLSFPPDVFDPDPERLIAAITTDGGPTDHSRVVRSPGSTVQFRDVFPTFADRRARVAAPGARRPVPEYAPLERGPYPLVLISPATHRTINSIFGEFQGPERAVFLHPDDAEPRGIVDGAAVDVVNEQGSVRLVARVSRDLRPGVCASPKGVWLPDGGNGINTLVPDSLSDLADGACFNDARVEVVAIDVRPGH